MINTELAEATGPVTMVLNWQSGVESRIDRLYGDAVYSRSVIAEVVSLSAYESQVSALLDEQERMAMEFFIARAPEDHPVIPGSGGFRVIYFFVAEPGQIYMAAIYAKSRKETLSTSDQKALAKLAAQIKHASRRAR